MNFKQTTAASAGLFCIALCCFFPPRKYAERYGDIKGDLRFMPQRSNLLSTELSSVYQNGMLTTIDEGHLLAECLCLSALTGIALLNLAEKKSKQTI